MDENLEKTVEGREPWDVEKNLGNGYRNYFYYLYAVMGGLGLGMVMANYNLGGRLQDTFEAVCFGGAFGMISGVKRRKASKGESGMKDGIVFMFSYVTGKSLMNYLNGGYYG